MLVNCGPARRLCLPDLAPAQAIVRAGERTGERWENGGAMRNCCPRARLALRFWRGAYPRFTPGIAFLSRRFSSVRVRSLRFCRGAFPWRASGIAFLSRRFSSVHACCLPCDKQDGLRYAPFLFRRVEIAIRAFSICQCGYLPLLVHFGFGRFFMAIPTGNEETRRTRGRGTESAANRECAFA